jgi:hypothetical protein
MAQNVGTPRFYINCHEYLDAIGVLSIPESLKFLRTNPTQTFVQKSPDGTDTTDGYNDTHNYIDWVGITPAQLIGEKGFCALLGHNMESCGALASLENGFPGYNSLAADGFSVNAGTHDSQNVFAPSHDGWSLMTGDFINFDNSYHEIVDNGGDPNNPENYSTMLVKWESGVWDDEQNLTHYNEIDLKCNSVVIGNYYDMPHSPDLNLKLSYEYDGVKSITTKGGATLSNASYIKPADWGDMGAWQLGSKDDNPITNLRSGRRVWDLSFSYLSDTDIMAKVAATSNLEANNGDYEDLNNPNEDTLIDGTDFFSAVWNRTLGGHLPFIFNPNGGGTSPNNNPDQFAICRFVGNSLQYEQVANNVYNVKLKIRECW